MGATFHKEKQMKYTTMAMYIDKHLPDIAEEGKNPDIESKIFEYLYHIIYALSCKGMFFKNLRDYDDFAVMGASELFLSMRNKVVNAGKIVRGREVKPVKNALDYIKFVLFPLKINFQKQNFATILNPEVDQDTSILKESLRESVRTTYRDGLYDSFKNIIEIIPDICKETLNNTPYRNDDYLKQKLYISCILTLINNAKLPNKIASRTRYRIKPENEFDVFQNLYEKNERDPILWHLDDSFKDYVILMTRIIKSKASKELENDYHEFDLSENMIESVLQSAYSTTEDEDI